MVDDYKWYEHCTKTLRESLMPVEDFMGMVKSLEAVPDMGLNIEYPPRPEGKPMLYVVPYPYTKSAYEVIMDHKRYSDDGSDVFTEEDVQKWDEMISSRCKPILDNRVDEVDILPLDDNADVGIFLNALTGSIDPFLYSRVMGIEVATIPINHQGYMLERNAAKFHGTIQEYNILLDWFTRYKPHNTSYVNLQYLTMDGDYWRMADTPINLTPLKPYSDKHAKEVADYVLASYYSKCKVIAIP